MKARELMVGDYAEHVYGRETLRDVPAGDVDALSAERVIQQAGSDTVSVVGTERHSKVVRVDAVSKGGVHYLTKISGVEVSIFAPEDELEPIPLTRGMLEGMGFVFREGRGGVFLHGSGCSVTCGGREYEGGGFFVTACGKDAYGGDAILSRTCVYLHEMTQMMRMAGCVGFSDGLQLDEG